MYREKSVRMTNNVSTEISKSVFADKVTVTNLSSLDNMEHNDTMYHTIHQQLHVSDSHTELHTEYTRHDEMSDQDKAQLLHQLLYGGG